MDPWADPLNTGYQTIQSLIALGSGGWFGVGLGASRQKWLYVPNAHTDFIFAILGEEMGLVNAWELEGDPNYGLAVTDVEGLTNLGDVEFIYYANDAKSKLGQTMFGPALHSIGGARRQCVTWVVGLVVNKNIGAVGFISFGRFL